MTPSTFRWSDAPLNSISAPAITVSIYLLVVFLLVNHMKQRGGRAYAVPQWLAAGHNTVLSVGSAVMLAGCLYEVQLRWAADASLVFILCESQSSVPTSGALFFWSYVYYLSKYYELLDTIIGLLRGSRMPNFGLQVYHHAVVLFMSWAWCETAQSLQFGGLIFNTFVHVAMYAYYTCTSLKIRVPKILKLGITQLQIVQFLTSFVLFILSVRVNWARGAAGEQVCAGYNANGYYAVWFNLLFNATLLVSFVDVFKTNAKKPEEEGKQL